MVPNALTAMASIARSKSASLSGYREGYKIGINSMGAAFEEFAKAALAGNKDYAGSYSWLGNQNFPPDAIARGGDAFEVKKHENSGGTIALNSSPPKDMLYPDDPRITGECREILGNRPIDIFYIVGHVLGNSAKSVYFVQGRCYAARPEVYEKISGPLGNAVKKAISDAGLESSRTTELGRVGRADPFGRSSLRVRGMWQIMHPSKAFKDIAPLDGVKQFQAYAIMLKAKYASLAEIAGEPAGVSGRDAKIPDPNNPAKTLDAKVLEVSW